MNCVEFDLDGDLYSADVVIRAAHRQSHDCAIELDQIGGRYKIRLISRSGRPVDDLRTRFMTDAVDELLREKVAMQTSALRDSLLAAALREATPVSK